MLSRFDRSGLKHEQWTRELRFPQPGFYPTTLPPQPQNGRRSDQIHCALAGDGYHPRPPISASGNLHRRRILMFFAQSKFGCVYLPWASLQSIAYPASMTERMVLASVSLVIACEATISKRRRRRHLLQPSAPDSGCPLSVGLREGAARLMGRHVAKWCAVVGGGGRYFCGETSVSPFLRNARSC